MDRLQAIGTFAATLAPGELHRLEAVARELIPESLPHEVAYEIVLQSHLFFGYPQAIEAAKLFREVLRQKGVGPPGGRIDEDGIDRFRERGEEMCRRVYQPNYTKLMENMRAISPELSAWMVTDGYGKVLSRPGPTPLEREIASIVFLSISNHPVQLFSHIRGAKNLGTTSNQLLTVLRLCGLKKEQVELSDRTISEVFSK